MSAGEPDGVPLAPPRPAVRVVCLDDDGRVLLLAWRDPHDGRIVVEPPGGGIEAGETPLDAARRELLEETGLDPAVIRDVRVDVERDVVWAGRRRIGAEVFFLARVNGSAPEVAPHAPTPDERDQWRGARWTAVDAVALAPGEVLEPPGLAAVLARLRAVEAGRGW